MGKRSGDRHRSAFMVRLPEIYRAQLNKLRRRRGARLVITHHIKEAVAQYLARQGLWPPEEGAARADSGKDRP